MIIYSENIYVVVFGKKSICICLSFDHEDIVHFTYIYTHVCLYEYCIYVFDRMIILLANMFGFVCANIYVVYVSLFVL